jgi:pimeloyl-ACP methyl ester carboxylesterase
MASTDEPLVLLPGHLCDERIWREQVAALAPMVSRIHVIEPGPLTSIAALADEVEARLPSGRFALAGFSLGGLVAFEIVARMPERVTRLALLDTSAQPAVPPEIEMSLANVARAGRGELGTIVKEFLEFLHAPATLLGRPDIVADATAMAMSRAPACYGPQQAALRGRPDRRPLLPKIACPTLVLCGDLDAITPVAVHEEMAAGIPGARLEVIPGAGHMTTSESPDAVNKAMRQWLSD